jgi:hypothetical protein
MRDLRYARYVFRVQRFILSRSGGRAGDVEAESRAWHIQCPVCGSSKSIWELGGVRYRAASRGKRIRGHCSVCGTRRWLHYVRIDPAGSAETAEGGDADSATEGDAGVGPGARPDEGAGPEEGHPFDRSKGDDELSG